MRGTVPLITMTMSLNVGKAKAESKPCVPFVYHCDRELRLGSAIAHFEEMEKPAELAGFSES